jgi:hypothetical protein
MVKGECGGGVVGCVAADDGGGGGGGLGGDSGTSSGGVCACVCVCVGGGVLEHPFSSDYASHALPVTHRARTTWEVSRDHPLLELGTRAFNASSSRVGAACGRQCQARPIHSLRLVLLLSRLPVLKVDPTWVL